MEGSSARCTPWLVARSLRGIYLSEDKDRGERRRAFPVGAEFPSGTDTRTQLGFAELRLTVQ